MQKVNRIKQEDYELSIFQSSEKIKKLESELELKGQHLEKAVNELDGARKAAVANEVTTNFLLHVLTHICFLMYCVFKILSTSRLV